jgi:hypothetical protein
MLANGSRTSSDPRAEAGRLSKNSRDENGVGDRLIPEKITLDDVRASSSAGYATGFGQAALAIVVVLECKNQHEYESNQRGKCYQEKNDRVHIWWSLRSTVSFPYRVIYRWRRWHNG